MPRLVRPALPRTQAWKEIREALALTHISRVMRRSKQTASDLGESPPVVLTALLREVLQDALSKGFSALTAAGGLGLWKGFGGRLSALRQTGRRFSAIGSGAAVAPSEGLLSPAQRAMLRRLTTVRAQVCTTIASTLCADAATRLTADMLALGSKALADKEGSADAFTKSLLTLLDTKLDDAQALLVGVIERQMMAALVGVGRHLGARASRAVNTRAVDQAKTLRQMLQTVEQAKDNAVQKGGRHADRLERAFAGVHAQMAIELISRRTEFDARSYLDTVRQVVRLPPAELKVQQSHLEYLVEKLKDAEQPIQQLSWQDTLASWQALMDLLPEMRAKRGVAILVPPLRAQTRRATRAALAMTLRPACVRARARAVQEAIFSDRKVLGAMGAAKQFAPANGDAPQELMRVMKEGLGGHIKANAFRYRVMIDKELARITRIKELQVRTVGLVGSVFVAALIGASNFVSTMVYDAAFPPTAAFPPVTA